jgi:Flp pilus assembly protein TadG
MGANRFKKRVCHRRAGAAMEMMLLAPILLMLAFGVVDYGYYFYVKNAFQAAANAGARAAVSSTSTNTTVSTVVSNMLTGANLQNSSYTITYSPSDITTAAAGSAISITVSTTWGNVGTKTLGVAFGGISTSKTIYGYAASRRGQ